MGFVLLPDPPADLMAPIPAVGHGRVPGGLDLSWFLDVNALALRTPWLHAVMTAYADYGVVLFAGLLLVGWWIARRSGRAETIAKALWAPLGVVAALAVNQPIVHYVAEPRPYTGLDDILVLTHRSNDFSFPSDHAVMTGAVAAGLWLLNRRLAIIATLAALLMAVARVYIAAHYPSDVGAGLLVGATMSLAGYALQDPGLARTVDRLRRSRLRPLLTASDVSPAQDAAGRAERDVSVATRPAGIPSPATAEHRPPKETNSQ